MKLSESENGLRNKYFQDAEELVQEASDVLLDIEKQPNDEGALNSLFRVVHTLKGSSSFIGLDNISGYAHEIENVLGAARSGEITLNEDSVDILYENMESLRSMIEEAREGGSGRQEDYMGKIGKLWEVVKKGGKVDSPVVQGEKGGGMDAEDGRGEGNTSGDKVIKGKEWKFVLPGDDYKSLVNSSHSQFLYAKLDFDRSISMVLSRAMATLRSVEEKCAYMISRPSVNYMEEEFEGEIELFVATEMNEGELEELLTVNMASVVTLEKINGRQLEQAVSHSLQEESERDAGNREQGDEGENQNGEKEEESEKPTSRHTGEVEEGEGDKAVPDKGHSSRGGYQETIRISKDKLDTLMNLVGQMITNRTRSTDLLEKVRERYRDDEVIKSLEESFSEEERIVSELQDSIMKSRMVPIGLIFNKLPVMIRNLSRQAGKRVEGSIFGETTELDKNLVDRLWEPLVHLVRNSIDHGIESEQERLEAGKPPQGRVSVFAYQEYNKIAIRVEDDGRGINKEKLIAEARAKNIMDLTGEEISESRLEDIIFHPGVSTKDEVTSISGRGVGMDAVKKTIERLSGSVEISSLPGKGTTVTIRLPLTLAIIRSLLVRAGRKIFAVPIADVVELLKVERERIRRNPRGTMVVKLREDIVEVFPLRELLGMEGMEGLPESVNLAVVRNRQSRVGIVVDGFEREREIVIKNVNGAYMNVEGISGATIMGDGSVVLILDIQILLKKMLRNSGKVKNGAKSPTLIGV